MFAGWFKYWSSTVYVQFIILVNESGGFVRDCSYRKVVVDGRTRLGGCHFPVEEVHKLVYENCSVFSGRRSIFWQRRRSICDVAYCFGR